MMFPTKLPEDTESTSDASSSDQYDEQDVESDRDTTDEPCCSTSRSEQKVGKIVDGCVGI